MLRPRKYLNLTDTDIEEVLTNFETIINIADSTEFQFYINEYHIYDLKTKNYNSKKLVFFCTQIYNFIKKKKDKLRVKSDLKLNKEELFSVIFKELSVEIDDDLKFQIAILFDYQFAKHEIYDHLDNMEDNYKAMYDKYLFDYDLNKI